MNIGTFNVFQDVPETVLISFLFLFFITGDFHHSVEIPPIPDHLCISFHQLFYWLLLVFCFVFFFHFSYCIVHLCLFFTSFRSLSNISFTISIYAYILLLRSCIIFPYITLNFFFQLDCLSPLHLVFLYTFNSLTSLSVFSFC